MVLIALAALIFLPPEKIPGIATQLGRFIGGLTRQFNEIKVHMEQGMHQDLTSFKKTLPPATTNETKESPGNPDQPSS